MSNRPRISAYLSSPRRLPFNQQGIFRHYPELASTGLANVKNAFEPWDIDERLDPVRHPLRAFEFDAEAGLLRFRAFMMTSVAAQGIPVEEERVEMRSPLLFREGVERIKQATRLVGAVSPAADIEWFVLHQCLSRTLWSTFDGCAVMGKPFTRRRPGNHGGDGRDRDQREPHGLVIGRQQQKHGAVGSVRVDHTAPTLLMRET